MQISGGHQYALALSTDGDVYAWGYGGFGATTLSTTGTPTKVSGLPKIKQISAGFQHAGAVAQDGSLWMWGYQFNGRLGNGASSAIAAGPQRIGTGTWKQVEAGNASTWGIDSTGTLYGWGKNNYYQLGISSTKNDFLVPTSTYQSGVIDVAGNQTAAIAVMSDGSVRSAGTNDPTSNLLGSGTPGSVNQMWAAIPKLTGAKEAAMGMSAAGVVTDVPQAQTWGNYVQAGRLGGTNDPLTKPFRMNHVGNIAKSTSVIIAGGMTEADAAQSKIAFGDPTTKPQTTAGWQLAKNISVVTVLGTKYLRGDVPLHNAGPVGVYVNWNDGKNVWSLTGCYTYTVALNLLATPKPAAVDDVVDVTPSVLDPREKPYIGSAVADLSIAALSGSPAPLVLAGGSTTGLSLSTASSAQVKLATPLPTANNGTDKWKYPATATARVTNGAGVQITVSRNVAATDIDFVRNGGTGPDPDPTCDVPPKWLNDTKVSGGVLGYPAAPTTDYLLLPVQDGGLKVTQVSMGAGARTTQSLDPYGNRPAPGQSQLNTAESTGMHTLYLDNSGNVWALGLNKWGQVGNGTVTDVTTPVMVLGPTSSAVVTTGGSKVISVSAGGNHSVAVTEDGSIYQWGLSSELGIGTGQAAIDKPTKLTVAGVAFEEVSAGSAFSLALSKTGNVYVWGTNGFAELGRGSVDSNRYPTPLVVTGLLGQKITKISAGARHALVSTGNAVYSWGAAVQAGNGDTNGGFLPPPQTTPYLIPAFSGKQIKQVEAAADNSYVLTSEKLYAWGSRIWGSALMPHEWPGVNTGNQNTPREADLPATLDPRQITGVFAGKFVVYLLTANGDVYAAGSNRRADTSSPIGDLGTEQSYWDASYLEVPAKVPGLSGKGITFIAAGGRGDVLGAPLLKSSRIALTGDGTTYGWGGNQVGQLGPSVGDMTYTPTKIALGQRAPVTSGTVYFGAPSLGAGLDKSVAVAVGPGDIVTQGGVQYFKVEIPKHVVGTVEVHTSWGAGGRQELVGCYQYRLHLNIAPDPDPQTAGNEITVRAYVDAGEEALTGTALVDFTIPAVGNQVQLVSGEKLAKVPFVNGVATTKVKLGEPWPTPNYNGTDWRYPTEAIAGIPSSPLYLSILSDPNAEIVSSKATSPKPWVWWVPPQVTEFPVHLRKIGESSKGNLVGMLGSEWQIYKDSVATPNTPDMNSLVANVTTPVMNPRYQTADTIHGWFTVNLAPGMYWLYETKAPAGFQLMAKPVQFSVSPGGVVQVRINKSGYISATDDWDPLSYNIDTITVRDPGATSLPDASSQTWLWITLLGAGLLGVVLLLLARRYVRAARIADTPQGPLAPDA
ncbi:hypothetical protein G7067_04105 [Leucobacter insecticola]|uniref:Uncharacterized protein n=1 Tax=Leucobacter insecticola TaxID=2714934 RepID=A0A6G8FHE8_9MICO|nr:hypothetical protein G7067_04105 [Leucobacter insecticola]